MRKLRQLIKLGWAYKIKKSASVSYPPYQFTIEPTNICNLSCDFCPQSDPNHFDSRPVGQLTIENFKTFLDKISICGASNKNLNLTLDGEPFINKNFISFIEMAAKRGYFCVFASNGTLINQEKADRLSTAGPFRASIDFSSDEKIYETIRGKKGHFELVRKNLVYLMEVARSNSNVHLDIHDITSFSGADAEESLIRMRGLFGENLPKQIRFASRQFHNFCGHLKSNGSDTNYRVCPYPWAQMAITHSGDCVPCCRDTTGRSVLGNLLEKPVMDIWNGPEYRKFRQNLLDGKPEKNLACVNCDLPFSGKESRWRIGYILRSLLKR
ncbi:MAG: SPASM domain-containing protein [candidate division Zixibacteria bacterium]|nr:SPASM domain-containing protein [candidate division Zixibacteria bacterium]